MSGASETTFVRSVRNYPCPERQKLPLSGTSETTYPIFMGQIKPGLCWQETTIRRCCYAHVWLLTLFRKIPSINANTLIRRCLSIHVWLTIVYCQVVTRLRAQNRSISQMTVASVPHMPFWYWTHVRRTVLHKLEYLHSSVELCTQYIRVHFAWTVRPFVTFRRA